MSYEITSSIPLPSYKYPFQNMAVGQSFFVPGTNHTTRTAAHAFGRRTGFTFTCRVVTENGVRGFRIWRTA